MEIPEFTVLFLEERGFMSLRSREPDEQIRVVDIATLALESLPRSGSRRREWDAHDFAGSGTALT